MSRFETDQELRTRVTAMVTSYYVHNHILDEFWRTRIAVARGWVLDRYAAAFGTKRRLIDDPGWSSTTWDAACCSCDQAIANFTQGEPQ